MINIPSYAKRSVGAAVAAAFHPKSSLLSLYVEESDYNSITILP